MTLKILTETTEHTRAIRLIGRIQAEHLDELKEQIRRWGPNIALELNEVNLVDVEVVRFLGGCKARGIKLLRCPQYIEEWIAKEWDRKD